MANRYFELTEDVQEGIWVLEVPWNNTRNEEEDPWMFTEGKPISVEGHLTVPIGEPGRPHDYCRIPVGLTPVVHVKLANVLSERAPDDVQLIPVSIPKHPDQYAILVATKLIQCIDEKASGEVRFWEARHGQPEKLGQYRSVYKMRIDLSKVGKAQLFRPWGWESALVVSEDIKDAMERTGATGMYFTEV
jgi:hypothetical protein